VSQPHLPRARRFETPGISGAALPRPIDEIRPARLAVVRKLGFAQVAELLDQLSDA
jgi:hypothetical protein